MTLLELAGRCERATGADFALDHDIVAALDIEHQNRWAMAENAGVEPNPFPLPRYTTSLDAAMTLAGENYWLELKGPHKYLNIPTPVPNRWSARLSHWNHEGERVGWGETPALALCAAALRARGETL